MQENTYTDHNFTGTDFSSDTLYDADYDHCIFTNCDFMETTLDACAFDSCTFISCNMSLMKIRNSTFRNVIFKNCKMVAIDWTNAGSPISINFEECIIDNSSFFKLDLRKMMMTDCSAKKADFEGTNLQGAVFYNTDFGGSTFQKTNLKFADFSSSQNYYIDPYNNNIRKAKFSIPEAMSFFVAMGVEIVD